MALVLFLGSLFLLSVTLLMRDALGELWVNSYRGRERNTTLYLDGSKLFCLKSLVLLSLICVILFLLSLVPLLLLFLSLVKHTKNL